VLDCLPFAVRASLCRVAKRLMHVPHSIRLEIIYIYIYICVCVCVCVQSCRYATVHNMNTFIFSDYVCFVFKHRLNSHTLEQMAVVCLKVSSEV